MEISISDAAKLTGYTTRQIRALAKAGKITARKSRNVGKPGPATWTIVKESLELYVQSQLK